MKRQILSFQASNRPKAQATASEFRKLFGDAPVDEEFLRAYCPKVIDGIEALCSWLKGK